MKLGEIYDTLMRIKELEWEIEEQAAALHRSNGRHPALIKGMEADLESLRERLESLRRLDVSQKT